MKIYVNALNTGINKAISVIQSIIDNKKFKDVEEDLLFCLISVIHSVGDVYERMKKSGLCNALSNEENEFLLSFVYLNNQLKHDVDLNIIYYEVCGSIYPMRFPFRFGKPGVYWQNFIDHGESRKAKRVHYNIYLNGKDVLPTLIDLQNLINAKYKY